VRYLIALHGINVVYSLLNAADESTEVTLELLDSAIETPIVRHYKEHPCTPTLEERRVLLETAGQIYINHESYEYFRDAYNVSSSSAHILDADMIAARYMGEDFSPKARYEDKEPHLLIAGGMSALNDRLDVRDLCEQMSRRRVHVHLYGYMVAQVSGRLVIGDAATQSTYQELEARLPYVHLHHYIRPEQFCSVWSRYDVGFMHSQVSSTDEAARFEQMNYPYRYTAYLAAGLPLAVSSGGQSAMRKLVEQEGIGLVYQDYAHLAEQLYDDAAISALSATARRKRKSFSFDSHADELLRILLAYAGNT
jgi:glycosyltransferase involved in cell wall biosynthesis